MRIFDLKDNIYDAVDAFVEHGVVAIGGTKTPALAYISRLKDCLNIYEDLDPMESYKNVKNNGYLYFLYDSNRFSPRSEKLLNLVDDIDRKNWQ